MQHHLAVLLPQRIELILDGRKTIGSCFTKTRRAPTAKSISFERRPQMCTAIGNLDHSLNQDCDTRTFYHTGVSPETSSLGVRVSDSCRISAKKLVLTLRNCGPN